MFCEDIFDETGVLHIESGEMQRNNDGFCTVLDINRRIADNAKWIRQSLRH
jgi:hypothetical protein